jgi:hypothetical protein
MSDEDQEHKEDLNEDESSELVEMDEEDEVDELEVDESDEVDELDEVAEEKVPEKGAYLVRLLHRTRLLQAHLPHLLHPSRQALRIHLHSSPLYAPDLHLTYHTPINTITQ